MNPLIFPLERMLNLLYPPLCTCCRKVLPSNQQQVCIRCQQKLPYTSLHEDIDNAFVQRFWGRIPVASGVACFYFVKGGLVQQMIHHLKYENKKDIGFQWGRIYTKKLLSHPVISQVDAIVPVPLHWKKQRLRGYNQAAYIARGVAEVLQKPHYPKALVRNQYASSQTDKSRMQRLNNVEAAFSVAQAPLLKNKHILLVDDVMTSGATLEACAIPILELENTMVSMLTLAIAM